MFHDSKDVETGLQVIAICVAILIQLVVRSIYPPQKNLSTSTSQMSSASLINSRLRTYFQRTYCLLGIGSRCLQESPGLQAKTKISAANRTFTTIGRTVSSIAIAPMFEWKVHYDLSSSDHLSILLKLLFSTAAESRLPKWVLKNRG